jgi:hypothetical protein
MKALGIVLVIVAGLLLAGSAFFGYFSHHNAGAAERLSVSLPGEANFIVRVVEQKSRNQRNLALALGAPGLIGMVGAVALIKKSKKA